MNVADSEVVASIMQMAGYELCENEAEADAIFLNTCSIRENAENKIYGRLETLHAEKRRDASLYSACSAAWLSVCAKTSYRTTSPTSFAVPTPTSICRT